MFYMKNFDQLDANKKPTIYFSMSNFSISAHHFGHTNNIFDNLRLDSRKVFQQLANCKMVTFD